MIKVPRQGADDVNNRSSSVFGQSLEALERALR
jgi:hypothetical protein